MSSTVCSDVAFDTSASNTNAKSTMNCQRVVYLLLNWCIVRFRGKLFLSTHDNILDNKVRSLEMCTILTFMNYAQVCA